MSAIDRSAAARMAAARRHRARAAELPVNEPSAMLDASAVDRRTALRLMGASLALSGLAGCHAEPDERALPYVNTPEYKVIGEPVWYATAVTLNGFAMPALGKTFEGRPVKLEGNPDHPSTGGGTDALLQAALLGLYDPARSQAPRKNGRIATWDAYDNDILALSRRLDEGAGEGFVLLTGTVTSPTLNRQIDALLKRWARARWTAWEPVGEANRLEGAALAFGTSYQPHVFFDAVDAVVALDDDPLGPGPDQIVNARRWAERRNAGARSAWFVAEPAPTMTGTMADHRLSAGRDRIAALADALANGLGVAAAAGEGLSSAEQAWLTRALADLRGATGRAVVTIGAHHPPALQALGYRINAALGAFASAMRLSQPIARQAEMPLDELVRSMRAGAVSALFMLECDPCYTSGPAFAAAMQHVPLTIHAGLHAAETGSRSVWHVPVTHALESWSDARARDGRPSIVQPLVKPFYAVRSPHALLNGLAGQLGGDGHAIVQETWRAHWGTAFETRWREALIAGFIDEPAALSAPPLSAAPHRAADTAPAAGLLVHCTPDAFLWDGRFAANPWLQEAPRPITKTSWGNVIQIAPELARERGLSNGDEIRIDVAGQSVVGPAWVVPGQEARTIVLTLGYGRDGIGEPFDGLGYNAYPLMPGGTAPWRSGATLTATGKHLTVACTQPDTNIDGFDFVQTVHPGEAVRQIDPHAQASLYPPRAWDSPSWGMAIDLDLCFGCNACVLACVAENNIPVVGKDLVAEGREMHWLRVDRYHQGSADDPKAFFQPVPCMHCEDAPCEMGCPVNATVHSSDGLNVQVYNRCIGTRTCSSYCPYKVRRFNWFDFTGDDPEVLRAARNPDVTVRDRGVMEKCTYCVQRINRARIDAKKQDRPLQDGEVKTACQQACSAQAITFGDVTDAGSHVSQAKADPRNYVLLPDANTRPRTTYLARIVSPDEEPDG